MACTRYRRFNGSSKTEIITDMLQNKRKAEFTKTIPQIIVKNEKILNKMLDDIKKKENETKELQKKYDEFSKKLGISWDTYAKKWHVRYDKCFLTQGEKDDLQKAIQLSQLNKRTEATKIYDKFIKDNELDKVW